MKPVASPTNSTAARYNPVLDDRKRRVRGLWRRNGRFLARLRIPDDLGVPRLKWRPLAAQTVPQAEKEMADLVSQRDKGSLHHQGRLPTFQEYLKTYEAVLRSSGMRPSTVKHALTHLRRWGEAFGPLRLDRIRPFHVTGHLAKLRADGLSGRTCNLAIIALRNLFKAAKRDFGLKDSPADSIDWFRVDQKRQRLISIAEIDRLCAAALATQVDGKPVTKNGQQLVDYLRFLTFTGARTCEALTVQWDDVDFANGFVCIGSEGQAKNREARHVDFNADLRALLVAMHSRRDPESKWVFPSPQRGKKDIPAKSFRESFNQAMRHAGLNFGTQRFHAFRHYFASQAVMAGVDFMTIARWLGHKDGGILVGKVYGHLAQTHAKAMAERLVFSPKVVEMSAAANG